MAYWLMKSEPEVYSFEQLGKDKTTGWNHVRNFVARNNMKAMRVGDGAFFYHSNAEPPGIAGTVRIVKEAYPDPTQFDKGGYGYEPKAKPDKPIWFQVDVAYDQPFKAFVSRDRLKAEPALKDMALWKYGRLSVGPVTAKEWEAICRLGGIA